MKPQEAPSRASSWFRTLQRVSVAVRSGIDLRRVLDQLTADAGRSLDLSLCGIARWDESGAFLLFSHEYRRDPDPRSPLTLLGRRYTPGEEPLCEEFDQIVFKETRAYFPPRAPVDPDRGPLFGSYMGGGVRAIFPLVGDQRVLGLVAVARPQELPPWTDEEVEYLRAAADLASVAVQHSTLRSRLRRLSAASAEINSRMDLAELLRRLTEAAMSITQSTMGVAGLREGDEMVCREVCIAGRWSSADERFTRERGLPGWSWTNRVPCITNDPATDPRADPGLIAAYGIRSALTVPIVSRDGEVLGFFEMHNRTGGAPYGEEEVHLASALAHLAALALEAKSPSA
ncbi:MAG TPA: GAF domain-containing protein [Candidatus Polarisedimenticolia bacterium]|jgi:GAF domain-containing protein